MARRPARIRSVPSRRWLGVLAAGVLVATVGGIAAGCVPEPIRPTVTISSGEAYPVPGRSAELRETSVPTPASRDVIDCGGSEMSIDKGSGIQRLIGDCPVVHLNGADLQVDATRATVGVVDVSGDRNLFDALTITAVTLHGQDNQVSADVIGSAEVNGDRNAIRSSGSIDSVGVHGNDNSVIGTVGAVVVDGARNQVGPAAG